MTEGLQWRRLYPVSIDELNKLHAFSWIEARVTKQGLPDPRPESRKIVRTGKDFLKEVGKEEDTGVRKWYVEQLVKDCSESMKANRETLGIVKPIEVEMELNEFDPKKNPLNDAEQTNLSAWGVVFDEDREQARREYANKQFELRFRFRCGSHCQSQTKHGMKVLDIEAFMLWRHVSKDYPDMPTIFQKMKAKIDDEFSRNDVYFVLGTHSRYPFLSYMVGTMIRIKKGTSAVKPLTLGF